MSPTIKTNALPSIAVDKGLSEQADKNSREYESGIIAPAASSGVGHNGSRAWLNEKAAESSDATGRLGNAQKPPLFQAHAGTSSGNSVAYGTAAGVGNLSDRSASALANFASSMGNQDLAKASIEVFKNDIDRVGSAKAVKDLASELNLKVEELVKKGADPTDQQKLEIAGLSEQLKRGLKEFLEKERNNLGRNEFDSIDTRRATAAIRAVSEVKSLRDLQAGGDEIYALSVDVDRGIKHTIERAFSDLNRFAVPNLGSGEYSTKLFSLLRQEMLKTCGYQSASALAPGDQSAQLQAEQARNSAISAVVGVGSFPQSRTRSHTEGPGMMYASPRKVALTREDYLRKVE